MERLHTGLPVLGNQGCGSPCALEISGDPFLHLLLHTVPVSVAKPAHTQTTYNFVYLLNIDFIGFQMAQTHNKLIILKTSSFSTTERFLKL